MDIGVAALLAEAAAREPGKTALSEAATGRSVSWAGLHDLADRVATGLQQMGLVAGYRVMVVMTNRIEFVAAYIGALRAGLVVVPVNPRSATGELVRTLVDCGARAVVADESTIGSVRIASEGVGGAFESVGTPAPRIIAVGVPPQEGEQDWDRLVLQPGPPVPAREDPESLAVLLYTSGTSGRPRAAMLSHRALRANIEQVATVQPPMISPQDVVYGVLPLFHSYGLNGVLGQVVRQQARLVLVEGFDPEDSLDLIEDEAISVLPVAPPVFAHWIRVPSLEERLGPVRLVLSGSAPLSADLAEEFARRTGLVVHQGYGLTEAAPVVTSTIGMAENTEGSVGVPLPGIELRLADHGEVPAGDDGGELMIRGENLFSGYWPDGEDGPDEDGWYATGDLGYLDDNGGLHLVDRVKDMVIVSGFNVYPSEVEGVVRELSEVAEAAVIGVPDEETGEAVVAYVQPAGDVEASRLADVVRRHCGNRLAGFKQPSLVHVVESLPHTIIGKVQKGRLRAAERRRSVGLIE